MAFKVKVLDPSPIPAGSTAGEALCNSRKLAQLADRMGYRRDWLAEHHGTPGLACSRPEVMIWPVAAATSRIRVGSGPPSLRAFYRDHFTPSSRLREPQVAMCAWVGCAERARRPCASPPAPAG